MGFKGIGRKHYGASSKGITLAGNPLALWHNASSTGYPLLGLLPSIARLRLTGSLEFHFIVFSHGCQFIH